MDARYEHPQVAELYGKAWTYDAWWRIEQAVLEAQIPFGIVDQDQTGLMVDQLIQPRFGDPKLLDDIAEIEKRTRHDVGAFLEYMRGWWGEPHGRWIHYGLTSSDLVDTAQGLRFAHLTRTLQAALAPLFQGVRAWMRDDRIVLGRTHGQPAEPTSLRVRAEHWYALLERTGTALESASREMAVGKMSGPIGTFAHNPPKVEERACATLGLRPQGIGASQIVPRADLAAWASAAAGFVHACAKVAMDIRLMGLLGEVDAPMAKGQVGSSSMAHKRNPIQAEQVTGLQRLAAAYAASLQPLDLWLERDLSNSVVERVAVPDLWHVLFQTIKQTTTILAFTEIDEYQVAVNMENADHLPFVSYITNYEVQQGKAVEEARKKALYLDLATIDLEPSLFLRNYPGVS